MLDNLRFRARALFRHTTVEQELDEELRFHFDREVEKYRKRGMSELEAKRQARLAFGGQEQVKENCRDARGTSFIELTLDDAKYAVRQLLLNPTFALVMILTLALSIGANSAIFSVINGVLLKKLPYPQPERLVRIFTSSHEFPKFPFNPWDFLDFRARNHSFEAIAAFTRGDVQLSGNDGDPVKLNGFGITSGFFRVLGLRPELGREFDFQAEIPGNGLQVILSDRVWRTRFAADPNIVGKKITINLQPFTVIGVMPPGTEHPGNEYHSVVYGESVDVWWPFSFAGNSNQRGSHFIEGIGRLKPRVSVDQASAEMNTIMAQLAREHPNDNGWKVLVIPLYAEVVGASRQMLLVLLGAVGIVLLIACANAANLLMVRASARQREIAVRLAMGAPRLRVVRQLLTESLLISCAGGLLGLLLAFGGVRALVSLLPSDFPRANDIHVSWPVLLFTLAVSLFTGILFGLAPALQASHTDPKEGLQKGGRTSTAGKHQSRLRSALVIAEVGLASVLLIGAGLMLRTFLNLIHLDPGFKEDHLLTATVSLPHERYKADKDRDLFYHRLMESLSALPGVESVGAGSDLPWTGYDENAGGFRIEGHTPSAGQEFHARYHAATPGYFGAMGIPLLEGRTFNDGDKRGTTNVFVINQSMAKLYWPNEDVIGKRLTFEDEPKKDSDWITVVGVVGDVKDHPNSPGAEPAFWYPEYQAPDFDMSVAIRTQADPRQAMDGLRQTMRQLNPELAVADVKLMNEVADSSVATPRFTFVLVGLFAGLAIVLAAIGAYGVISYTVGQRAPEFGLRVALGAQRGDLLRMVLAQSAKLTLPGILLGLVLALSLGRAVHGLVYGVSPSDPAIMTAVVLLVLGVALLASYVPARRAASADPMAMLRAE